MNVLTGSHPRSRRRALGVVMGLALAGSLVAAVPAQAATSPGTACTKLNAKTKGTVAGKSVTLTCRAAAGARVWTDTRVISLSVIANAIKGGKNASTAEFIIDYVIPNFVRDSARSGYTVRVAFTGRGVGDEDYKAALALDLRSKRGADVMAMDGFWMGEFADAKLIKPLKSIIPSYAKWEGWTQINKAVQATTQYKGEQYGIPLGTDGRLMYFNKDIFTKAGLPTNWQPKSWAEILTAARTIKEKVPGVWPMVLPAGTTDFGEAAMMQGFLPFLIGTGEFIYDDKTGKWAGNTAGMRQTLQFYKDVYGGGLANPVWTKTKGGRDASFEAFSKAEVGIYFEGDYAWRGPWNPTSGNFKMANRNTVVGYAQIPAVSAGKGVNKQSFVSMTGGSGYVLNPNTKNAEWAWKLFTYMNSREATLTRLAGNPSITARADANAYLNRSDPLLQFVQSKVLPTTHFRPKQSAYSTTVTVLVQKAMDDVISGDTAAEAAAKYQAELVKAVGAAKVNSN